MIDYEVLRFIWWLLVGILLIGFAVTDGFDMGVGMLTRFLGRNDTERRIMINSIAPHWDGNQVWLITAGGALFAAWPMVYAAAFSGFYVAMILVLASLFFRPVGFDYRSKIEDTRWRNMWDWGIFIGSFVPPLVIGVAFGTKGPERSTRRVDKRKPRARVARARRSSADEATGVTPRRSRRRGFPARSAPGAGRRWRRRSLPR